MQIVGLIGRSYCGSTLLSLLLGSIEGVESVGEPHWLLDDPKGRGLCTSHDGEPCPTSDPGFLSSLTEENLYGRLGMLFGCRTLVSSDKYEGHFQKFVKPGTMDGIICFRAPTSTVWSDRKHKEFTFLESVNVWTNWYKRVLPWAPGFCRSVSVVDYDLLALNPGAIMKVLCKRLGLSEGFHVPKSLSHVERHNIGGNPGAYASKQIVHDKDWRKGLTGREVEIITEDKETMDVYRALRRMAIKV